MAKETYICTLDYLIGTLSTSYKGLITSLVLKDFCIAVEDGEAVFSGTVMNMPEGDYDICLIFSGVELSRTRLKEGLFELKARSSIIDEDRNLQLDIIQHGRHIGTFLLKKRAREGLYGSALELSKDVSDINFRMLNESLKGKKGLVEKAEGIISSIVSTKKDWRKLSEKIIAFSKDLFWYERPAFYLWFDVLLRFAVKASLLSGAELRDRMLSNCLFLMELPLENESEEGKLRRSVESWLREAAKITDNLPYRYEKVLGLLEGVYEKLPDVDIRFIMAGLLSSLKRMDVLSVEDSVIHSLAGSIGDNALKRLQEYSVSSADEMRKEIIKAEHLLGSKEAPPEILAVMGRLNVRTIKSTEMIKDFFDVIEENVAFIPEDKFKTLGAEAFRLLGLVSEDALRDSVSSITRIMETCVALGTTDHCRIFLELISTGAPELKDILLNAHLADAVLKSNDSPLISAFTEILTTITVPPPSIAGFSDETWAEIANPLHYQRIAGFMNVLSLDLLDGKDLMLHFLCTLYISGAFIPDDKLFQREVSKFLNSSAVQDDFMLSYMLLRKLPVFHSEVGATGRIRDLTTEIDSWGNDTVIYFLRKQVHVNASNYNIPLVETIMEAWANDRPEILKDVVPREVFNSLNRNLVGKYSAVMRPLLDSFGALDDHRIDFGKVLRISERDIEKFLKSSGSEEEIAEKVRLIFRIHKDIHGKYALTGESEATEGSPHNVLSSRISQLKELKAIYTSPGKTAPQESLYFKRHIAFGIPSVIGTYHEPKFDALGEALRTEETVRITLERLIERTSGDPDTVSREILMECIRCLEPVKELFELHGLENMRASDVISIINANRLNMSQITDLIRIWQDELTWMVESFYRMFHRPLLSVLGRYRHDELPDFLKRLGAGNGDFQAKAVDIIIRDMLNSLAGFEELDRLLNSLIKLLTFRVESGRDEIVGIAPDAHEDVRAHFVLDELSSDDAVRLGPYLGNKAKNLVLLLNSGLSVPHGVTLSSSFTPDYESHIESKAFDEKLRKAVSILEEKSYRNFGGSKNPLFVSVRSGSFISMPGVLDSVLYCGMNKETLNSLIDETSNPWLAWDSYGRFIAHYTGVVLGADLRPFEEIRRKVLLSQRVRDLRKLSPPQMELIATRYLEHLAEKELSIPEDVHTQLQESVHAVYRSWYKVKAANFRKALNIAERWGTAVTIMQMIIGNDRDAGTSVFFTRKPFTFEKGIYGETRESATGDDLVSGKFSNRPLATWQGGDVPSLEEVAPSLFEKHAELARQIEDVMGGLPQEVEATYINRDKLFVLQTKRMEFGSGLTERFDDVCDMATNIIGRGIGVHGGALSGIAAFESTPDELKRLKERTGLPVVLLTRETSTDDVSLMPEIDGIVTSIGGAGSHAAILAQKFDISAVVGCSDMQIRMTENGEFYARIGKHTVQEGSRISIDGSNGLVYAGTCIFRKAERYP